MKIQRYTAQLVRGACLLVTAILAACDSSSQPDAANSPKATQAPAKAQIPTTVEDANQFVQGTWTYTGQGIQHVLGGTWWLKLVFHGSQVDVYQQPATADSWTDSSGLHDTIPFQISAQKYSDSGKKYFAIQFGNWEIFGAINSDGTLRYKTVDYEVNLTRGDANPFSK